MNILKNLHFSSEKPAIWAVHKSDKINVIAVGLQQNQVLKEHIAYFPTLLTVVQGSITFLIDNQEIELHQWDSYHIPVEVPHEVIGLEERNIFILVQEK